MLAHQRQNIEYDGSIDVNPNNKSKPKSKREMQAKEIDKRLKKGAYDVFWDEDDTESQQFMETDIDQLLERSSPTVTYGSLRQSTMISGLGRFSKASFLHQLEMEMARMLTLMILNSGKRLLGLRLHMIILVSIERRFSLRRESAIK